MAAAVLATVARPTVTNQGLKDSSASRVKGKVPPKITTPSRPSARPMVSRDIVGGVSVSADWVMGGRLASVPPEVPKNPLIQHGGQAIRRRVELTPASQNSVPKGRLGAA